MKISVDTNIIVGFWLGTPEGQRDIQSVRQMQGRGDTFLVCGVVYTELCAAPGHSRASVEAFLKVAGVGLDYAMPAPVWEAAADANAVHQGQRRRNRQGTLKRVVPDFLIGAHALHRADALLTRNPGDFADFPGLALLVPRP